jgi:hypothetical protein
MRGRKVGLTKSKRFRPQKKIDEDKQLRQVKYRAVTIKELLSLEFIQQISENNNINYFNAEFIVDLVDIEWAKYFNKMR